VAGVAANELGKEKGVERPPAKGGRWAERPSVRSPAAKVVVEAADL
jgi:hypothetical protein